MDLRCPYCDAYTAESFDDIIDRPADDFETHSIGITCGDCDEYYEISYWAQDILFWDDNEPRTASTATRPVDRSEDKPSGDPETE